MRDLRSKTLGLSGAPLGAWLMWAVVLIVPHSLSAGHLPKKGAPPKERPTPTVCTLEKWQGTSHPTGRTFGPDQNEPLHLEVALTLTIPAGRTANFMFWNNSPQTENAMVIYDDNFHEIAKKKMAGGKDFKPLTIKAGKTSKSVIITGWHKDNAGAWDRNFVRAERYAPVPNMWLAATEDSSPNEGDYRDFVAQIVCS